MRAIVAFRGIGCGYSAIKEWCEIMNMPFSFSQNTFNKINGKLNIASKETSNEIRQQSVVNLLVSASCCNIEPQILLEMVQPSGTSASVQRMPQYDLSFTQVVYCFVFCSFLKILRI